ncbi:hypothetical protein HED60_19725 [Planctomycetales bacterium ZRK34]|nr:hypothetical protein HED60_19725 [Planctomycetales bacterium ZRK34]
MIRNFMIAVGMSMLMGSMASAGIVLNGAGQVAGWSVTPFSQTNQVSSVTSDGFYTIADDYAPVNYPHGVGYQPSPGGSTGELFDLEEMHVRRDDNTLQVLVVLGGANNTSLTANSYSHNTYYLGDLFVTLNGVEFGIVTDTNSQGLTVGDIYRIDDRNTDTRDLQNVGGSYYNDTHQVTSDLGPGTQRVRDWAAPWAVDDDIDMAQLVGSATLDFATFDYAGEQNTVLIEYTIDLDSLLGSFSGLNVAVHQAWGCGNDIIEASGSYPPKTVTVPTPAAANMGLVGLGLALLAQRKLYRRS